MKKIVLILILLINSNIIVSQAPTIEWQKCLGGKSTDYARSIQLTTDGGYIVTGSSYSIEGDITTNQGLRDCWIVKLDISGAIEWEKSLGGSGYDDGVSIQQTADGGYIVLASSDSNDGDVSGNHGYNDYWVIKLNNLGAIQWKKTYGGSDNDFANSIQQTTDGGYIVAGTSHSQNITGNHGSSDYWIVKINSTGAMQWQKSLGGTGEDYGASIQQTIDDGYIVSGYSHSQDGDIMSNHGSSDAWIVKLDSTGIIQWEKSLGGSNWDLGNDIRQTADGGYIFVGHSRSNDGDVTSNYGYWDIWIVKLNNSGSIQWQTSLGGTANDFGQCIQQTIDGGFIVCSELNSTDGDVTGNHGGLDIWIVKIDDLGAIQWQKTLGGTENDYGKFIQQTPDGGYIVAGNASINGDIIGNHGGLDIWIVKLSPVIGIEENSSKNSITISPNPSKGQFHFSNLEKENQIEVYDLTGRLILETVSTNNNCTIDLSNKNNGIYFYKVIGHTISSGKLIKQ